MDSKILWIRIEEKCWIQIRTESIRIHNPALNTKAKYSKINEVAFIMNTALKGIVS
jgi:hypothetical protein